MSEKIEEKIVVRVWLNGFKFDSEPFRTPDGGKAVKADLIKTGTKGELIDIVHIRTTTKETIL